MTTDINWRQAGGLASSLAMTQHKPQMPKTSRIKSGRLNPSVIRMSEKTIAKPTSPLSSTYIPLLLSM